MSPFSSVMDPVSLTFPYFCSSFNLNSIIISIRALVSHRLEIARKNLPRVHTKMALLSFFNLFLYSSLQGTPENLHLRYNTQHESKHGIKKSIVVTYVMRFLTLITLKMYRSVRQH